MWLQVHAELLQFVKVKFEKAERAARLAGQPVSPSSQHVQHLRSIASRLRTTINSNVKPAPHSHNTSTATILATLRHYI